MANNRCPPLSVPSLSSWRAWIEIAQRDALTTVPESLSSWRAWIEITVGLPWEARAARRSPHGERGLKYLLASY